MGQNVYGHGSKTLNIPNQACLDHLGSTEYASLGNEIRFDGWDVLGGSPNRIKCAGMTVAYEAVAGCAGMFWTSGSSHARTPALMMAAGRTLAVRPPKSCLPSCRGQHGFPKLGCPAKVRLEQTKNLNLESSNVWV